MAQEVTRTIASGYDVDVTDHLDIVIGEWQDSTSLLTFMRGVVNEDGVVQSDADGNVLGGVLQLLQGEIGDVLKYLDTTLNIDLAAGVWLDYLGRRLGFPRPFVSDAGIVYFGFEGSGVGFDQAIMRSDIDELQIRDLS